MVFVHLMIQIIEFSRNILSKVTKWQWNIAFLFVGQRDCHFQGSNGHLNVTAGICQRKVLNGLSQISVMIGVLVISIKFVVDPMLWVFGQLRPIIWTAFAFMIHVLTHYKGKSWWIMKIWPIRCAVTIVKERILMLKTANNLLFVKVKFINNLLRFHLFWAWRRKKLFLHQWRIKNCSSTTITMQCVVQRR